MNGPAAGFRWAAVAAVVLAAGGCGRLGSAEDANASSAALAFYASLADPSRACAALAPGTLEELEATFGPCQQSLPQQQLPSAGKVRSVEVFGKDAIVRLDRDVMFMARFPDGWKVTAAGCTPKADRPYDCTVKGD